MIFHDIAWDGIEECPFAWRFDDILGQVLDNVG